MRVRKNGHDVQVLGIVDRDLHIVMRRVRYSLDHPHSIDGVLLGVETAEMLLSWLASLPGALSDVEESDDQGTE